MIKKGNSGHKGPAHLRRKVRGRRMTDQTESVRRLRAELAVEKAKREVLHGISRISRETQSHDKLYDYYLTVILKLTRTRAGAILLVDAVTKDLVYVACRGKGFKSLLGKRVPMGKGITGWVARTGQKYFTGDPECEGLTPEPLERPAADGRQNNILCVPLKISRRIQGVIEIVNKKNRKPFLREDRDLLDAIVAQVATVIENTQLFEQYESKVRKLKALKEFSRLLNSTLDEKEVRKRAMEAATQLMDAELGSLLLIDEDTNELYFEVALGHRGLQVKEIRLKIGEGIAGWVAKTGRPVIVPDARKDPRFTPEVDQKRGLATRNMICVPIKIKSKIIGVLQALNKRHAQPFSKWDLEEFQSLADQVGTAIENANLYKELRAAFFGTAQALGDAIEAKDAYTAGHTQRVLHYSVLMGRQLRLSEQDLDDLRLAAMLHDIGKIGIEDGILRKPDKLSETEKKRMAEHTTIGPKIVDNVKQLRRVVPGIMHHHEEYDGSGYPLALKGEQIPLVARIIAVADCFDAMTTDRPYRKSLPVETAIRELRKVTGRQFDGKVVQAFIRAYDAGELEDTIKARPAVG